MGYEIISRDPFFIQVTNKLPQGLHLRWSREGNYGFWCGIVAIECASIFLTIQGFPDLNKKVYIDSRFPILFFKTP